MSTKLFSAVVPGKCTVFVTNVTEATEANSHTHRRKLFLCNDKLGIAPNEGIPMQLSIGVESKTHLGAANMR